MGSVTFEILLIKMNYFFVTSYTATHTMYMVFIFEAKFKNAKIHESSI